MATTTQSSPPSQRTTTMTADDRKDNGITPAPTVLLSCLTFGGEEVDQRIAISEGFLLERHLQKVLDAPPPPGESARVEAPAVRVRQVGEIHCIFTTKSAHPQNKAPRRRIKQAGPRRVWAGVGGVTAEVPRHETIAGGARGLRRWFGAGEQPHLGLAS